MAPAQPSRRGRAGRGRRRAVIAGLAAVVGAATVALGATRPALTQEREVRRVPSAIADDCSVDVTARLARWIEKVPDGSVIELRADGCYRIDGTLVVRDRRDLTIDGNGASLEARTDGDQARRHLWLQGGKRLVVRDLTVRGANPRAGATREAYSARKAFQHAFAITGVTDVRLEGVQAYDVYGDFVYIGSRGPDGKWSKRIRITDSRFEGSGRQGIAITAGKDIAIKGNRIGGVGRSLVDLEANRPDGGAIDVRVVGNTMGAAKNFWLANGGAGTNIGEIVFRRNEMVEPSGGLVWVYGPLGGYRGPYVFEDNVLSLRGTVRDEGSRGAFFLSRAADVLIRDNVVTFPTDRELPAVELRDSENVRLEGNTFTNAGEEILTTQRRAAPG